ncbi:MAG: hypothetical protein AAGG11_19960 [Pseudomonadota bacterium]
MTDTTDHSPQTVEYESKTSNGLHSTPQPGRAPAKVRADELCQQDGASHRRGVGAALRWLRALKHRRKELFWAWIAYQTVKGILTTSLIWVPLIFWWIDKS